MSAVMTANSSAPYVEMVMPLIKVGRLTNELAPLQSGVGSVANAVLNGFLHSEFENCSHLNYTEQLRNYYNSAVQATNNAHTPHLLNEALAWHVKLAQIEAIVNRSGEAIESASPFFHYSCLTMT